MNDLLDIGEDVLVNENPLDILEKELLYLPQLEFHVEHHFHPGFYLREFHAPAGAFIISKIHRSRHQYSISKGSVSVWDEVNGVQLLKAGDTGITEPGTRRALLVHEDLIWTTAHCTMETDLDVIESILIDNKENDLLSDDEKHIFNHIKQFHSMSPDRKTLKGTE